MIQHWQEVCTQVEVADKKLTDFINNSGQSVAQLNKIKKFFGEWNKMKKMMETFDTYLSPVDPIKVESPFDQDDFRFIWRTWKDYLTEQHCRLMRSRMEQQSLLYLAEISENNPDLAISYLRFAMANGYKSFFKVEDKQKTTPPKNTKEDGYY
jgi:hypothetical protein